MKAKRWLAAGAGLIAALACAECVVRLAFADEVDLELLRRAEEARRITPFTRASVDPELGFELEPGVDIDWHGTRVRIHPREPRRVARAFERDESAPDELRLAVVGDSTPFGWGVELEESYPELVRRKLEARTGRPVVLRDYGTPGYNSRQNRITFAERVRAWRPHLLVVHHDHNDSAPNDGPGATRLAPEFGENALGSALWKLVRRRWQERALLDASTGADAGRNAMLLGFRYAGDEYERGLAELAELARMAREDGLVPLLFVFNAGLVREDPAAGAWPRAPAELERLEAADHRTFARLARSAGFRQLLHEPLAARATSMGYEVVDTYAPVQAHLGARGWESLRPLWLSKGDNHPNRAGHAFLAEVLFEALLAREPYHALTAPR